MKQEHVLSCQVARYLRMRGYITADCDVMSALKYLPLKDDRNRAMFVKSRKEMGYTLGQSDLIVINKYGNVSYLELKNGKAGKQSDNQKYFEQEIKCRGGNYVLIRTFDDCVKFVNVDLCEPVALRNTAPKIYPLTIVPQSRGDIKRNASKDDIKSGAKCSNNGEGAELQLPNLSAILEQ